MMSAKPCHLEQFEDSSESTALWPSNGGLVHIWRSEAEGGADGRISMTAISSGRRNSSRLRLVLLFSININQDC